MTAIPFHSQQLHLYVITDDVLLGSRDPADAVAEAIAGGATLVQYRAKHQSRNAMYATALRLREVTHASAVPLVVNDFVDLALAVQADGVHLGQRDLPLHAARVVAGDRLWYGVSTNTLAQAHAAAAEAPAYLAVGPVYPTGTKSDPNPVVGLAGLRAVRAALPHVPLVAIGGITAETAGDVRAAGANGVSVISAAWRTPDIAAACRALTATR